MENVQGVQLGAYSRLSSREPSPAPVNVSGSRDSLAETPHHPDETPEIAPREFDHRRQLRSLFWWQSLRWLGTLLLSTLLIATLKIYERKGNFTRRDKRALNVIMTGLSVGLAINFFEAFKESAKALRWKFMANGRHSVRELDLILGIESLWKVMILGVEYVHARPWAFLLCAVWIFLNISAQISVALIGFTYDLIDGKSYNDTYTDHGMVNSPNLTCYYDRFFPTMAPGSVTIQATAHMYGEEAFSSPCGLYEDIEDVYQSKYDYEYYCRLKNGSQQFAYRFKEYNPLDVSKVYPRFTNRVITASAGECLVYSQQHQTPTPDVNGDGDGFIFTYTNDSSFAGNISLPKSSLGLSGTTYIYRGSAPPQLDTVYSCGSRCMWMWVYKNPHPETNEPGSFYECPITINPVGNSGNDSRTSVSDDMARIAATSIALQGRWSGQLSNPVYTQYQFYPWGTDPEIHGVDTNGVGANMARFAIASISRLASFNRPIQLPGVVPYLGSHLEIKWWAVGAIFGGVIAVHFALYTSAIWSVRKVAVKDDSFVAIARLLRPLVDKVGNAGTLLEGKELSRVIQRNIPVGSVVYGPRRREDHQLGYYLDVGEDVDLRQQWEGRRHPDGIYL